MATCCICRHYSAGAQLEKECGCGPWSSEGQDFVAPSSGHREYWTSWYQVGITDIFYVFNKTR